MSFRKLITLLGVSLGATHCGGGPAPVAPVKGAPSATAAAPPVATTEPPPAEKEVDIEALFAREREPLPPVAVSDPAGRWRATIEAKGEPVVTVKKSMTTIKADVGTKSPVTCFVYDGPLNAAASIARALGGLKKEGFEVKLVAAYHVGAVNQIPFVVLRAAYHAQENGKVATGDVKLAVSPRHEYPLFCLHDEPGYAAAFDRTVEAFARSLEATAPKVRSPRYAAVWATEIDGLPVGFTWERTFDEPDGSTADTTLSAQFLPVGPGELRATDGLTVNKHYPSGLDEGTFLGLENDATEYQIELRRQGGKGGYRYAGQVQGKAVNGTFRVEGGLFDDFALLRRLKKAKGATKPESFVAREYHPKLDPTRPVEVRYKIDPAANLLGVSLGQVDMSIELRDGQRTKLTMPLGSRQYVSKLIDQVGKP